MNAPATPAWLATLAPVPGLPAWAREAGGRAAAALRARGLPGRREEAWRYTRLDALRRGEFRVVGAPPPLDAGALPPALGPRVVFAGGHFVPSLSTRDGLPAGVSIRALAAIEQPPAAPDREGDFVPALNAAARTGGALIELAPGLAWDGTLEVLYLDAPGEDALAAPWLGIRAGAGARVRLLEQRLGSGAGLEAARQVIALAPGAQLEHLRVLTAGSRAHALGATDVRLEAGAHYRTWVLAGGGALVREELRIELAGEGAEAACALLYTAAGTEQTDLNVCVEHAARSTRSRVRAHGVAGGHARAVFNGRVHVHPGADGTDARLDTANLLLSALAEVDAKPELEIYADDVQCAHGATVGSLDPDQFFYLRSRGIGPHEARALLVGAFARAVLAGAPQAGATTRLEHVLDARLAALAGPEEA